jgi:hypothetical protein
MDRNDKQDVTGSNLATPIPSRPASSLSSTSRGRSDSLADPNDQARKKPRRRGGSQKKKEKSRVRREIYHLVRLACPAMERHHVLAAKTTQKI